MRLHRCIFEDDCFRRWRAGDNILHLFLDSLDECLVRVDNVASILEEEFSVCPSERLRLRIACRTAEWPMSLEGFLKSRWGEGAVGVYELTPLRRSDVAEAAQFSGVEPGRFLTEVEGREAVPLAIKPVTLRFLLNTFKDGRELPRTQAELYRTGCQFLCEERNEGRRTSPRLRGQVDPARRLLVASRIAAAMIFCGRTAIWTEPDSGDVPASDLTIVDLLGTDSDDGHPFYVSEAAVREVLGSGLFSSRGPGRLGFAHQTYAEFLASDYLRRRGVDVEQAASLLLHPDDLGGRVVPQLQEPAAWLAGMDLAIFDRIMHGDPQVLLRSDVATTDSEGRRRLADALLRLFEVGNLSDTNLDSRSRYQRLDHPGLADQLAPYIRDKTKEVVVRRFAIDVAESCRKAGLQGVLADVALDLEDDEHIRSEAAGAVARVGDDHTRLRLLPCLTGDAGPDSMDDLKGWALRALWPRLIGIERVLAAITPPKKSNYTGAYRYFFYGSFAGSISDEDLPTALEWAARHLPSFTAAGI